MTILMIACSSGAYELMRKLEEKWEKEQPENRFICKVKCSSLPELSEKVSLSACVGDWFYKVDAIVFFAATGIAVRGIAPYIRHKGQDPAVLVVDEAGAFCVSLLSGHAGGANEMAKRIGAMLGAMPVITTATDREGKFAVDDFARKNGLYLADWQLAKEISVAILAGEKIGFCSEFPVAGSMPEEICPADSQEAVGIETGIFISCKKRERQPFFKTLQLVPKLLVAGIGCRKDTPEEKIRAAVERCLAEEGFLPESLGTVASIDLKKQEKGILDFCETKGLLFLTYSAEELEQLEGKFTASDFVKQVAGVSNVCERSAAAAAGGGLLCGKKVYDGVTVALAQRKGRFYF